MLPLFSLEERTEAEKSKLQNQTLNESSYDLGGPCIPYSTVNESDFGCKMNLYYKRAAILGLGLRQRTQQCQNVGKEIRNVSTDSSSSGGRTHYEVLGVHRLATQKEIKEAYLQMSRKFHPDMVGNKSSVEEMVAVNVAFSILSKPLERRDYDRRLGFNRYTTTHTEDGHEFKGRAYDRPATWEELVRQYRESEYWEKASRTQHKAKKKRYILHTSTHPTSPLLWFFMLVLAYSLIFSHDTSSELNQDVTAFMSPSEIAKAKRDKLAEINKLLNQKRP